jgi:hypothetical protein
MNNSNIELDLYKGFIFPLAVIAKVFELAAKWDKTGHAPQQSFTTLHKGGSYSVRYAAGHVYVRHEPTESEVRSIENRIRRLKDEMGAVHVTVPPELVGTDKGELAAELKRRADESIAEKLAEVRSLEEQLSMKTEARTYCIKLAEMKGKSASAAIKLVKETELKPAEPAGIIEKTEEKECPPTATPTETSTSTETTPLPTAQTKSASKGKPSGKPSRVR